MEREEKSDVEATGITDVEYETSVRTGTTVRSGKRLPGHIFSGTDTGLSGTGTERSEFPETYRDISRLGTARLSPGFTTAASDPDPLPNIFPTRDHSRQPVPTRPKRTDRPQRRRRRVLPTVTQREHAKYQKERARRDATAAAPIPVAPQIIVLPGAGAGRPGPPGPPGMHGAPGAAGGGGGGAAGAAAAAAASGAAGAGAVRKPEKKKAKRKASGITKAKKRYTDQRKIKMAEMRSLKAKRLREFAARTKKMPKKQRDDARKEFKSKANARYREMVAKFPPARGLRDLQSVLGLISKLETVRMAR